ncbi:MAG TPA: hypothetical protein VL225_17510 [Vicinamibacterales bacterium]|jgi:hypothetical protein|nr:hypothetical protein [Vicinamibacterales bacterium]
MADFFLSIPGLIACVGIGALILIPGRRTPSASRSIGARDPLQRGMQVAVSLAVLGSGLWVILSGHYDADAQRWASGAIGTVVGYWLKP